MALQVVITFPRQTTLEMLQNRIKTIRGWDCNIHFDDSLTLKSGGATKKIKVSPIREKLSKDEVALLDQALELSYRKGDSPVIDSMAQAGVGRLKPNLSSEIVEYYKEHPGHTTAQGAGHLAEKFFAHYESVNEAFRRIRALIDTMTHSKGNQKVLEMRDGKPGRGNAGKVFVMA